MLLSPSKRRLTLIVASCAITLAVLAPGSVHVFAQNRMNFSLVAQDSGHVALGLALRKLNVSGTFLQIAAHPDDEHNALFAMFTHGMGLRSSTKLPRAMLVETPRSARTSISPSM